MLYGTTLLRAFSALLLVSVLTACGGGGGSGGDDTNPPVTPPTDNGGGGGGGGGTDTGGDTGGTGGDTGGTGGDTGGTGGDTGGTGGDTGGTGGDTGGTGGDTGGGGGTGGGEEPPPAIDDVTGVWHVEIAPEVVTLIEKLNQQPGIVDEWLPGRKILVVDHDDSLEISTCIDNPNLPATYVVWDDVKRVYIPQTQWTFGNLPIEATIARTDNQLTLMVKVGTYEIGFAGTKLTTLNNSFALSSEAFDEVFSTSLVCGAVTSDDNGSALQVTAYVADNFLNLSFPEAAAVGNYTYDAGEIQLLSEPLSTLLDTTLQAATLDVIIPQLQRIQLGFDLTTVENVQLHGDVILNQFTLP